MNDRDRFANYVHFRDVDRPPRWEWAFRDETTELWYGQGLPKVVPNKICWAEYFDLDRGAPFVYDNIATEVGVNVFPLPDFSQEVLKEDSTYVIKKNQWGAVEKSLKDGVHSIPQFLSFPVEDAQDFKEYKKRLDPSDPNRYPSDWQSRRERWKQRDYPLFIRAWGWYGVLRKMMGVEGLSLNFYDRPALIEEISEFWGDFLIQVFDRALAEVDVDYVLFWEDLAYKTASLVSPDQFKRFFLSPYKRVVDHFRSRGVNVFMVDSDGNIDEIIPHWLDVGVNIIGPFEVAAGMDVVKVGQTYKDLIMVGGIDKMEIARGRRAIEAEVLRRVQPLMDRGGYIPTLDHAAIPELSLDDYRHYREFLLRISETHP